MAAPSAPAEPTQPNPHPDCALPVLPPRIAGLLNILRLLITFGRSLALPLQNHLVCGDRLPASVDLCGSTARQVLLRIARGLRLARALEQMLLHRAATGRDITPVTPCQRVRQKRAAKRPRRRRDQLRDDDPPVRDMPTAKEIAALLRRRPIGAILAQICGDLGITQAQLDAAMWDELRSAITEYGGSFHCYYLRILQRAARALAVRWPRKAALRPPNLPMPLSPLPRPWPKLPAPWTGPPRILPLAA